MKVGRPTEYDPEKIGKSVIQYINDCKSNYYLPTIAGLSVELGVSRECVYEWARVHEEFSDIIEQLRGLQESMLIQNGLKNEYNPTITKLMLAHHHDYREKQDVTTGGKELPVPIINLGNKE